MSAANTPRPRRVTGRGPSTLAAGNRPRKVADSRRVADRSAAAPGEPPPPVQPPTPVQPVATGTDVADGQDRSSRRRPGRLTVVLATLAAVLSVAVGLVAWDLLRHDARADARRAAQVVAPESVENILSYDHASYDNGVAAAKSLMTNEFAKEYTQTIEDVRSDVLETESVVKAEVVAASVVSVAPERVKALLFVNQTTTGKQVEQPRVDLNRVTVTLVRGDDGGWLVSDLAAL